MPCPRAAQVQADMCSFCADCVAWHMYALATTESQCRAAHHSEKMLVQPGEAGGNEAIPGSAQLDSVQLHIVLLSSQPRTD
jgi:hypothetical protein